MCIYHGLLFYITFAYNLSTNKLFHILFEQMNVKCINYFLLCGFLIYEIRAVINWKYPVVVLYILLPININYTNLKYILS